MSYGGSEAVWRMLQRHHEVAQHSRASSSVLSILRIDLRIDLSRDACGIHDAVARKIQTQIHSIHLRPHEAESDAVVNAPRPSRLHYDPKVARHSISTSAQLDHTANAQYTLHDQIKLQEQVDSLFAAKREKHTEGGRERAREHEYSPCAVSSQSHRQPTT